MDISPLDDSAPETDRGRLKVSLRVMGEDLDPADVTRHFGAQPSWSARRGDVFTRLGRTRTRRVGVWLLEATPRDGWPLSTAIDELLDATDGQSTYWRELPDGYRADVYCGLFMGDDNQSLALPATTLARLAERGLALGFDVYGPPPDVDAG